VHGLSDPLLALLQRWHHIVQLHDDIAAQLILNVDRCLGRQECARLRVVGRRELNTLFTHLHHATSCHSVLHSSSVITWQAGHLELSAEDNSLCDLEQLCE